MKGMPTMSKIAMPTMSFHKLLVNVIMLILNEIKDPAL
jgi:hypothetical protein